MENQKPDSGLWINNPDTPEGKYLVKRRDGSIVEWPNFTLGARDAAAPTALRAYANKALALGMNQQYVNDIFELADKFDEYRREHGEGDPDKGKHRIDDPVIIEEMKKGGSV